MFSGSYAAADVQFLLRPISIENTTIEEKERLIQSGKKHYSEMLTFETAPDPAYENFYDAAVKRNGPRLAADILQLAAHAQQSFSTAPTIVSIARAGTPIGVLLRRALLRLGINAPHYSISLLRGRGIDQAALRYISQHHAPASTLFVDGWCGKGGIAAELRTSIQAFNQAYQTNFPAALWVISDPPNSADYAVTNADYLLPNALLNSTVSGLVSRTIAKPSQNSAAVFHGCVLFEHLRHRDRSQHFIDTVCSYMDAPQALQTATSPPISLPEFISKIQHELQGIDPGLIKPGVGEASRALLRRKTKYLWLKDSTCPDIEHLLYLAAQKSISVQERHDLPCKAVAIVQKMAGTKKP